MSTPPSPNPNSHPYPETEGSLSRSSPNQGETRADVGGESRGNSGGDSGGDSRGEIKGEIKSDKIQKKPQPDLAVLMAGERQNFIDQLEPFLPSELIGGSLPYIPGTEEEAVWNAASQACATEKVHYVYTVEGNRVWYLACPSYTMVSNPDSWCPLAAALPGNSEFWDKETVYIFEKDGFAGALRWDPETMRLQIFLGAARSILPRIQTMDANFVTINPQMADIVPWKNRQLRTEQLSRAMARMLLISGLVISVFLMGLIALQYIAINIMDRKLDDVRAQTEDASVKLLNDARAMAKNDVLDHTYRIQELLDDLTKLDGTLVRYEMTKGKLEWEALIPAAYASSIGGGANKNAAVLSIRAEVLPGIEKDGRLRIRGTR